MRNRCYLFLVIGLLGGAGPASSGDSDHAARVQMARQIARERNDPALVSRVESLVAQLDADPAAFETRLREVESAVGIDPGGWSMAGQPLARLNPENAAGFQVLVSRLGVAMAGEDVTSVHRICRECLDLLGDQAGLPDGRRPGSHPRAAVLSEAEATKLFLDALAAEGSAIRRLRAGQPLPDQMIRGYAGILSALASARPEVAIHQPDRLADVDALAEGIAGLLLRLQQPAGHFPFPDLRGRNIRFGEMIQREVDAGNAEVRDGWVISPDPAGGTQFDTGLAGQALLAAGQVFGRQEWTDAGIRAAEWAIRQRCVPNFNYNAFSVSLLSSAFRATGDSRYLDVALAKFRLGVEPGQAPNGRWMDPHNARTVYHVILLRSLTDLLEALPPERETDRAAVVAVFGPARNALLDEFDAMGITVEALPELLACQRVDPDDDRLTSALQTMAASLVEKCTDGRRIKMGTAPNQLAVVSRVRPEPTLGSEPTTR